jgi:hypothetical protein
MAANAVVRARIDARVKEEATAIYAAASLCPMPFACSSCEPWLSERFLPSR